MHEEQNDPANRGKAVEEDRPAWRRISLMMVALAVVLVLLAVGMMQLFERTARDLVYSRELALVPKELLELRAQEQKMLEGYDVVDANAGLYQVPVERGMELLLQNPSLIKGLPPLPGQAAAQPTAAPTEAPPSAQEAPKAQKAPKAQDAPR